jgi:PAS domain-containing protein
MAAVVDVSKAIAAALSGRYAAHVRDSLFLRENVLRGPRAKRGPAFSLPHAAVPGPIGLLCKHWKHLRTTNVIESSFATVQPGSGDCYPKADKPYMFGLHQWYPRVWTPQEEQLFRKIGRRIADALSSLLMFRSLRESEARLEEAQRIAHVGYWERDLGTNLITWSDETLRIFGLSPQHGPLSFARYRQMIHPEDQQTIVAAVAEALRGGRRYDLEYIPRIARSGCTYILGNLNYRPERVNREPSPRRLSWSRWRLRKRRRYIRQQANWRNYPHPSRHSVLPTSMPSLYCYSHQCGFSNALQCRWRSRPQHQ